MPNLIVTGFGPFSGVEANPSEWLVKQLADEHAQAGPQSGSGLASFEVLEVSANSVRDKLRSLANEADSSAHTIWVHFGVDSTARTFKLERLAYNEATFRVPDQAGWEPQHERIDAEYACDHCLSTDLAMEDLAGSLRAAHDVQVSQDAGRFVCNYTLYSSLWQCQRWQQQHQNGKMESAKWQAVFVHVPPFSVIEPESQLVFARSLLQLLKAQPADVGTGSVDSTTSQSLMGFLRQYPVPLFGCALLAWLAFSKQLS